MFSEMFLSIEFCDESRSSFAVMMTIMSTDSLMNSSSTAVWTADRLLTISELMFFEVSVILQALCCNLSKYKSWIKRYLMIWKFVTWSQ